MVRSTILNDSNVKNVVPKSPFAGASASGSSAASAPITGSGSGAVISGSGSGSLPGGAYSSPYGGVGGNASSIGIDTSGQSDDDYLAGDSSYQAQLAALMKALQDQNSEFDAQKGSYNTNYSTGLRQLGWTPAVADDPNTPDVNEAAPGAWNQDDLNTASGRSVQNQLNDFASRGLLQSSLFGTAKDNLMRSLNDQVGSMDQARQSFLDDLARQQSSAQNQNTTDQQNARADALARRAAGLSLV